MASFDQPLEAYHSRLRPAHAKLVRQRLKAMVAQSGVDVHANRATVKALKAVRDQLASLRRQQSGWKGLRIFLWVLFGGGLLFIGVQLLFAHLDPSFPINPTHLFWAGLASLGALLLNVAWLNAKIASLNTHIATIELREQALLQEAWQQLAPLNDLFSWDTVTDILRQTLPETTFDKAFLNRQFEALLAASTWRPDADDDFSVHDLQTGTFCGNPFALVKGRTFSMGEKCYYGSRTVFVQKSYTDSNGRRSTRSVPEVLTATIVRPYPEYNHSSFLLFAHHAAPNLSYSRNPSKHSGKEDSFFNRWSKRRTEKELEKFSRNLDDEYGFTMMANREFETLFYAKDRSDEREFRLLFTPYAQQQMVALLNDTEIGYGDNFRMIKEGPLTAVLPLHLPSTNQSLDPSHFYHYDIDALQAHFIEFNESYFKALYFALAPLMTIPLYCQPGPRPAPTSSTEKFETSLWENELIANVYGDTAFAHPDCVTPCILKTKTLKHGDATIFKVTAHGFRSETHVAHVPIRDSNGRTHQVPVEWEKFIPVQHTRQVVALPDQSISPTAPDSLFAAESILHNNGYAAASCEHIRATYTTLV